MSSSRVVIILSIIAAFPAWAEHRRDVQENRAVTPPVEAVSADADEEAVPPQLEQAVRSAERAIQSRSSQDLLGAIMMLLPYYYAENPPSAESSETDALLRELLAQRSAPPAESSPAIAARDDEKAFFNAVGKKENEVAPIAEAPTPPREATDGYSRGVDAPSAAAIDNSREEVAVAPVEAPLDAGAPIAAPANKRKARAKSKSVATRLMASLLDSLKQSKMAEAASKETAPVGIKPVVAAAKLASAEIPALPISAKSETQNAAPVQQAATGDKLNWLGWAVVFFLLAIRQLHWMTTRGRNKHHG